MQDPPHPGWQQRAGSADDGDQAGRVYGGSAAPGGSRGGVYGGRAGGVYGGQSEQPATGGARQPRTAGRSARAAGTSPSRPGGRSGTRNRTGRAGSGDRAGRLEEQKAADSGPRESTSRRRRTPIWATFTVTIGAVLALFSGVALAGGNLLVDRYTGNVQQENLLGDAAADPTESLEGPINLLLLGLDARQADTDDMRSDTIIVLHVPSTHDQAYLISVPRDTWVTVPGYWDMKITDAFFHGAQNGGGVDGGTQLIASTLHHLTGLSFNAAGIINFRGFEKIIDEMGGIEYCVTDPAVSEHFVLVNGERMGVGRARREGHWPQEPVRYEAGCQHMAGWQALDYVRQRKNLASGEGDYGRQRNQQQLLQAMAKQATSNDVRGNLATVDGLLLAAGDTLTVDTNQVDMLTFLFTLRNIRPADIVALRTNAGSYNSSQVNGQSVELLTPESLQMFTAAANDSLAQFVLSNPDFVNQD